jgi:hypothetical protein
MECLRAIKCVRECGGTAVTQGCCGCTAPLFDDLECARDSAGAGGASGQNDASVDAASGRSDARACEVMECFRANECVSQCGGAVVSSGCCACEAPLFDKLQCD